MLKLNISIGGGFMENFNEKLEKYADLAVKVGINVQKGQTLVVNAPIAAADFVRMIAKKAYEAGAKNVHVEWNDQDLALIRYMNAPDEAFKEFPKWKANGFLEMAKGGAAFLGVGAPKPGFFKDVNPERLSQDNITASEASDEFTRYLTSGKTSWSGICIPTKEWAEKVFPELDEKAGIEKLWENIFKATRVDTENPVKAWNEHIDNLKYRLDYLNGKKYKKLIYKSKGTDLTIELSDEHVWLGGGLTDEKGTYYIPNMPTEEVFTAPLKGSINGCVSSTMPLSYAGNIIDNFTITFKDGRIVDFTAEKGYETLKRLIETDEGSHYIGEVALIPCDSPISESNIIFYNTLFDENASCHLAIGMAYPLCIKDGGSMNKEELEKHGANTSFNHVDFMIGSKELNIDGVTVDGNTEPIFKNGNWAFKN